MPAPLCMARQVRESCSSFHSSCLQPADLQRGRRAPSLNKQLHSRVTPRAFLFIHEEKRREEKNCVGMNEVCVHIYSPILYSLSSFYRSVAF